MRIGLYGGTFSPPHNGHRMIAKEFVRQCGLDLLLIMPASVPPHKAVGEGDDPTARLEMARLAFSDVPKTVVSRLELDRVGKSYTYDTLTALYGIYGTESRITLLTGTDMFLTLDGWYRGDEILCMADVAYAPRGEEGETEKLAERAKFYETTYGTGVTRLDVEPYRVSSSEVRELLADGGDASEHIPEKVMKYIVKNGLYGTGPFSEAALSRLRREVGKYMSAKRYAHTLAVEKEAEYIAEHVCPEKCSELRAAALLHDIAKELSSEKQLNYIRDFDIMGRRAEDIAPPVRHAAAAPGVIRELFPEYATDEILSAVCYHTTGRGKMTLFDTVIFIADYTEKTRRHERCIACRKLLHTGFDASKSREEAVRALAAAALMSLTETVSYLVGEQKSLDTLALDARNFFAAGNLPE